MLVGHLWTLRTIEVSNLPRCVNIGWSRLLQCCEHIILTEFSWKPSNTAETVKWMPGTCWGQGVPIVAVILFHSGKNIFCTIPGCGKSFSNPNRMLVGPFLTWPTKGLRAHPGEYNILFALHTKQTWNGNSLHISAMGTSECLCAIAQAVWRQLLNDQ